MPTHRARSTYSLGEPSPTGPPDTCHSDGQSDHISPAPDFHREESGALWKGGTLHQDHLVLLVLVILVLALLGTQAGPEILEALAHLPGVRKGLWVRQGRPPPDSPSLAQRAPALGTLTSGVPAYAFCFWSVAEVKAKERCLEPCQEKRGLGGGRGGDPTPAAPLMSYGPLWSKSGRARPKREHLLATSSCGQGEVTSGRSEPSFLYFHDLNIGKEKA